jgi:hypothetical protein
VRHGPRLALNRHETGTEAYTFRCSNAPVRRERSVRHTAGKPTIRQVYAIARLLLAEAGEAWPENREEASELIERLRDRDEGAVQA